jgi:hypothetical protein
MMVDKAVGGQIVETLAEVEEVRAEQTALASMERLEMPLSVAPEEPETIHRVEPGGARVAVRLQVVPVDAI